MESEQSALQSYSGYIQFHYKQNSAEFKNCDRLVLLVTETLFYCVIGMADSCFVNLESEVFDDQIVPDTDDCFLPPSEPQLASNSPVAVSIV